MFAMATTQAIRVIPAVTCRRRRHPRESPRTGSSQRRNINSHVTGITTTMWAPSEKMMRNARKGGYDGEEESRAGGAASGDGDGFDRDVPRVGRGRLFLASTAALVLTIGVACDGAKAFVPVRGCSDPGSPYDTGISAETTSAYGVTGCTKLYQPARAAELRAAAAARQAAAPGGSKDADGRVRGRTTTDELGSNDSN